MCIVVEGLNGSEVRHFSILKQKKRGVKYELSEPEKDCPCNEQGQLPQHRLGAHNEDQKGFRRTGYHKEIVRRCTVWG